MTMSDQSRAWLVGGGIASPSAAVLSIRDGGVRGTHIRILEELQVAGGALDGSGDAAKPLAQASGQEILAELLHRLPVIPPRSTSVALLGQYVEIPEDVVFTVEYSVRGAMHAVYGLLGLTIVIPPIYHGIADPRVALASLRTLLG